MTPEFIIGDLVEYISYTDPTDNWREYPITAVITGFYDYDTHEVLGNNYTTHDRVICASILSDKGIAYRLLNELALLSSAPAPRC
tara:strand:+ start:1594 stop:1848 length:255 start_codon:yes stop_codon:yes gene_type:complete